MSLENESQVSIFDEIKIQTQVILPILNSLRAEIGKEKADKIVFDTLKVIIRRKYHEIGKRKSGNPYEKWVQTWDEVRPRIGDNVERDFIKNDSTGRIYNVTRCKFAEYFKEINEPELGMRLMCDFDQYIAEIGEPIVKFTRTKTIMEGGNTCDFCYVFNNTVNE